MPIKTRDERVEDLLFIEPEPSGQPDYEGQVRLYNGDLLIYIGGQIKSLTAGASGGEANTGKNEGDGVGVFQKKVGVVLQFKSLVEGQSIVIADLGDHIEISSTALTPQQHRNLRHLIHFIDGGPADGFLSGAFKEVLPQASPFPTSVTWYTSSGKTQKIVEKLITRSGGGATNILPTPITWIMYDEDGVTIVAKVIDSITYSGVFEYQVTREIKILSPTSHEYVTAVDGVTVLVT
jgi:hypothetical protein